MDLQPVTNMLLHATVALCSALRRSLFRSTVLLGVHVPHDGISALMSKRVIAPISVRFRAFVGMQLVLLLCVSCSSDHKPAVTENSGLNMSAPRAIVEAGISLDALSLEVRINGRLVDMQRVGNTNQWTGSDSVTQGQTFRVIVVWRTQGIELAVLSREIADIQSSIVVSFPEDAYTFVDSDSDTFSNLEEIAAGSDVSDPESTPETVATTANDPNVGTITPTEDAPATDPEGEVQTSDPVGEPSPDPVGEDPTTDPVGNDPTTDPVGEDPTTDPVMEDPTPDPGGETEPPVETVIDCSAVDCVSANEDWSDNAIVSQSSSSSSTYAMGIQRIMYCLNYGGTSATIALFADGIYGPNTALAVSRYQEDQGLLVDGIVGAETWDSLQAEIDFISETADETYDLYEIPSTRTGCAGLAQFAENTDDPNDWKITSTPGSAVLIPFSAFNTDLP